jgi:curved DNA-binding protein CbpA
MKSAYSILGVPGNASASEIEQAYLKAKAHYSKTLLVEDPEAITRLTEIREAHKLLTNADMRAAHDRKLSAAIHRPAERPRVVIETAATPWYTKPLVLLGLLVVAMFAMGSYMSHSREQARVALAAQELAQKKLDAETAARAEAAQTKIEADRARAQVADQNRERQLRYESSNIARNAAYADMQQQAMVARQVENDKREAQRKDDNTKREAERRDSEAKAQDRQQAYEAQRRLAADQARIRELCMQQYRKPNC